MPYVEFLFLGSIGLWFFGIRNKYLEYFIGFTAILWGLLLLPIGW